MAAENEMLDEALMVRLQNGDHRAFSILVERHTQRFYACAYRVTGRMAESEDIVQEAFLKLWTKPDMWNAAKGAKFTTWFYRVVTNLAIDWVRKQKQTAGEYALEVLETPESGADEKVEAQEQAAQLERAIQALPERQKMALNLCVYEELSQKEAAEVMGVKVKALESLLSRAKQGVKDILMREGMLENDNKRTGSKKGY